MTTTVVSKTCTALDKLHFALSSPKTEAASINVDSLTSTPDIIDL